MSGLAENAVSAGLLALVERLASVRDIDGMVSALDEEACAVVGCDGIGLFQRADDQIIRLAHSAPWPMPAPKPFPLTATVAGRAILGGEPMGVADILAEFGTQKPAQRGGLMRGAFAVPVPLATGGTAALGGYWSEPHVATPVERERLTVLARAVGRALETIRMLDALREREDELAASRSRFQGVIEALPQLVWTADGDGRCTYLSQQWLDYTGMPEAPQLQLGWLVNVVHPDDRDRTERVWQAAQDADGRYDIEYRLRRADGAYRWFRALGVPFRTGSGTPIEWFGTCTDIHEMVEARELQARSSEQLEQLVRSRTQALEEANVRLQQEMAERRQSEARLFQAQRIEAVGQLTSGVAHDFNNLLTVVLGNIEVMENQTADPKTRRRLAMMRDAAERGGRLTAQLLAFSRRQRLEAAPTDLNGVAGELRTLLPTVIGSGIDVALVLEQQPWLAMVDPNQIELMILNLVLNARDALANGGTITVRTANRHLDAADAQNLQLPAGDYVEVTVCDDGSGMEEAVLARAFEPFFTTKPPGKNSGLGLAQVWGFTRQSGGVAVIRSEPGKGTQVSMVLPRAEMSPAELPAAPEFGASPSMGVENGAVVLVVDDDSQVREVTAALVAGGGYKVLAVSDGQAALARLEGEGRVDLLLTDYAMPGMDGRELAERARAIRPDLRIMVVSGFPEFEPLGGIDERCIVRKPFSGRELLDAIGMALASPNAECGGLGMATEPALV
jgi:PAS domain S-box-containing protein